MRLCDVVLWSHFHLLSNPAFGVIGIEMVATFSSSEIRLAFSSVSYTVAQFIIII